MLSKAIIRSSSISWLVLLISMIANPSFASIAVAPISVGGGYGVQIKPSLVDDVSLSRIHRLGFSYVRFSLGWQGIEIAKNVYDWKEVDALIAQVRFHGLKMVIPILGGNVLYSGYVAAPFKNTDNVKYRPHAPNTPEAMDAYARFASQLVLRYGGEDIIWEIGNEPDLARFWPPKPDAVAYSVLAELTCKAMRRVHPRVVVIGPALGRLPDVRDGVSSDFMNLFLTSPASRCLDAVSVHPYRHGAEEPEAAYADYEHLVGLMARHKVYSPIVTSEWGYTTTQISEEQQRAYVLRRRLVDMVWGIPLSIWYEWRDSRDDASDPEGHFGLLDWAGKDKPVMQDLEEILPDIHDAVLEKQIAVVNPRDMLLILRKKTGMKVLVGWSLRQNKDEPAYVTIKNGQDTKIVVLDPNPRILGAAWNLDAVTVQ